MSAAMLQPSPDESAGGIETIDFDLPDALAASEPPEARGLGRDGVRLMVSRIADDRITHARFTDLPELLAPGDLLVVNASATFNAALAARRDGAGRAGQPVMLHLSSPLPDGRWAIELRQMTGNGTAPLLDARPGEPLSLVAGAAATLVEPSRPRRTADPSGGATRLWVAVLEFPGGVPAYAATHGSPIRYAYVPKRWPLEYYQTIFASESGSAEMPSAGRAFTREMVGRLERRGVGIAPLVLHAGVASLESDEPPYPERFRVPDPTAEAVNRARAAGGRVVAVGTTVVRALETVAAPDGRVHGGGGWTDLVVTPDRGLRAVDALITGFHAPRATHLAMLETLAGRAHLATAYRAALDHGYLWHEFGDLHLILLA